jgi:hypothetical protein
MTKKKPVMWEWRFRVWSDLPYTSEVMGIIETAFRSKGAQIRIVEDFRPLRSDKMP